MVASLLGSAARAEVKGQLAEQLQVALRTRVLIEQAKGALMVHQDIDEATAFEWLRLGARSTSRTVNAVAQDILAGRWPPMPDLAAVVGRLAQARRTEQRAHQRAIDLHEQAADRHAQQGREDQAQADRDRAASARTRLQDALAEDHQASRMTRRGSTGPARVRDANPDRPAGVATRPPRHPTSELKLPGTSAPVVKAAPTGRRCRVGGVRVASHRVV